MKKLGNRLVSFFLLFLVFTFHSSPLLASEASSNKTWIISQSIKNALEDIKTEDLISALTSSGISAEIKDTRDYLNQYEVLKGKYFTIYLAPIFYHQDQVWILANSHPLTSFEDMSREQLQELESFRYLIGEIYEQHMKYQGYAMFIDFKKDYGLGHPAVCLEMIPAELKGPHHDELDMREKISKSSHILFGDGALEQLNPQKAAIKIKKFKSLLSKLQAANHILESQKRVVQNTLPWKRKTINYKGLQDLCLQSLKQELLNRQDLFIVDRGAHEGQNKEEASHGIQDGGEFTSAKAKVIDIEKCVFCDPKVISKQFVYKFGDFLCIYNFRPYTLGYHFMVTPSIPLHIEDWQNFSLDDVLQIDQFSQAIIKAIKQESGRDDIILFVQNGIAGGMTVPHGHMHILLRPTKFHFLTQVLLEISGHKRKGLTAEEMAPVKEKFKERLQQLL